jgi:hypothetical protein
MVSSLFVVVVVTVVPAKVGEEVAVLDVDVDGFVVGTGVDVGVVVGVLVGVDVVGAVVVVTTLVVDSGVVVSRKQ